MFNNFQYDNLHHLSISRIAEYWTKLLLTLHGFDVYTTEVDNKGIDFIVRHNNGKYYDIQVKSIRYPNTSYAFIVKEGAWTEGNLRDNLLVSFVVFKNNQAPELHLFPSTVWLNDSPIFKDRKNYSKPEWGINYSQKNAELFTQYLISNQITSLND
jgi:hypothetical protein